MNLTNTLELINAPVRALKAYHLEHDDSPIKLNQNENPFDWPQSVKDEVAEFCRTRSWNRYPTFIPQELRALLAEYTGVSAENVIAGNGSNEMLLVLLLALAGKGKKVITVQPTFTVYQLLSRGLGADLMSLYLDADLHFNVDAIVDACEQNPGAMLILCSPNNPTGATLSEAQIREILAAHQGFCLLDQAYIEFGGYNAVPLIAEYPNLIVTRTFSKAFSGAGLRFGYMLGTKEVIAEINKIKLPYNINYFSENVAKIMLSHRAEFLATVSLLIEERKALFAELSKLPFDDVYPSEANFIMVRLREDRKDTYFAHLKAAGILIRDVSAYPMLCGCLRISIGTPAENAAFLAATKDWFATDPSQRPAP